MLEPPFSLEWMWLFIAVLCIEVWFTHKSNVTVWNQKQRRWQHVAVYLEATAHYMPFPRHTCRSVVKGQGSQGTRTELSHTVFTLMCECWHPPTASDGGWMMAAAAPLSLERTKQKSGFYKTQLKSMWGILHKTLIFTQIDSQIFSCYLNFMKNKLKTKNCGF